MPAITQRRTKGSELTYNEVDDNFQKVHPVLRSILDSAATSFWNNTRTRGVMASPPTITVGTSTAPAGFTRSFVFGAAGHPFISGGGVPSTTSGITTFPVCTVSGSTKEQVYWRVETILDGDEIAFLLSSVTANGYRFLVDGQYVSLTGTTSAAGSERYYTLTFPTRARRRITVEGQGTMVFGQARVKFTDTLTKPAEGPTIYVVGDSNWTASGEAYEGDGAGAVVWDHLGVRVDSGGAFGTGFLATDSGTKNNYAARRTDWTTTSPDMVVFNMSINDFQSLPSNATIKSAVATELIAARSALGPQVPIIVFADSIQSRESWVGAGLLTNVQGWETAAAEAVSERNDALMAFIPVINSSEQPPFHGVDGTDSNFAAIYNNGTNHLNAAGYRWWGQWYALQLIRKIAEMAGVEPPTFEVPQAPISDWSERRLTADEARTNDTSTQNWFASAGSLPLLANSTYEFEGELYMTQGSTSAGINHLFAALSGASTRWSFVGAKANDTTQATAVRSGFSNTFNTARNVTTASTVTGSFVRVRGVVRTTTAGNLTPQFSQTAASGACTVLAGTFFKVRRVGSNAFVNSGDWV